MSYGTSSMSYGGIGPVLRSGGSVDINNEEDDDTAGADTDMTSVSALLFITEFPYYRLLPRLFTPENIAGAAWGTTTT